MLQEQSIVAFKTFLFLTKTFFLKTFFYLISIFGGATTIRRCENFPNENSIDEIPPCTVSELGGSKPLLVKAF